MSTSTEPLRSEAIAAEIEAAEKKQAELQGRIAQLSESIEELQDQLGRAMAGLAGSISATEIRSALREAQEERDACERGLEFLSAEQERMAANRKDLRIEEAAVRRDEAVAEAVGAIDELAASVDAWKRETLPLIDRALCSTDQAMRYERLAAAAAGRTAPSASAVWTRGWARYQGLESLARALPRFSGGTAPKITPEE